MTSRNLLALPVVLLLAAAGVGEEKKEPAEVTGTVTLRGKPMPAGWIVFHGKRPADTAFATVDDGKYTLKNAPVGDFTVMFDLSTVAAAAEQQEKEVRRLEARAALLKQAKKEDEELGKRIKEAKARLEVLQAAKKKASQVSLPARYTSKDTTPLKVSIMPGKNNFDIKMED